MKKSDIPVPDKVTKGNVPVLERLKALNKEQLHAVLATETDGQPYTSIVAFALSPDGKGIIFSTPVKTQKFRNILKNQSVSLLIDTRSNTKKDYMNAESLTILGKAIPLRKGKNWSELANVLISKHPALNEFIHSPGTKLIMVKITKCIHVTQFQTVSEWISE